MRNHWLQLHRVREAKKECVIYLSYTVDGIGYSMAKPWSDECSFKIDHLEPGKYATIENFFIRYQGERVYKQQFDNFIYLKNGEEFTVILSKLEFSFLH